jgi:formamidopyrimidine-DNA glycosylase
MAELPEITVLASQMLRVLKGKVLTGVVINQPKCLNVSKKVFLSRILHNRVEKIIPRGKWIFMYFRDGNEVLLLNTGMGADIVHFKSKEGIQKEPWQFRFDFDDGSGFTIRFWWFGYVYIARQGREIEAAGNPGPSPFEDTFTFEWFDELLERKKRMGIKNLLMNQKLVSGIGNVYVQDVLFLARTHPLQKIEELSRSRRKKLYEAIHTVLGSAVKRGMPSYEKDFFGKPGSWSIESLLVGYRTGKPCPECGATIEKIKTGSTSTYICPQCQKR